MQKESFNIIEKNFPVSRETIEKFSRYTELLLEWNQKFNLIGKNTKDQIINRHILDSLQISKFIEAEDQLIDIGTGAGFPGMVLAITGFKVTLVESIAKKCKFLEEVKKELNLDVEIINDRIENIKPVKNSIITARAVASLDKLFKLAQNHIINSKKAIFMKGENYKSEIKSAQIFWHFNFKEYKSLTSDKSKILEITNLKWK